MIELRHARIKLALHARREAEGTPLLLLHELGGSSATWPEVVGRWPGSVYALDFSGHGSSDRVRGGAYTPELLAADADIALQHIGVAAIAGAGLGAYVAVLLAGARPDLVPAALLLPGRGLEGGGEAPDPGRAKLSFVDAAEDYDEPGLAFLAEDLRPGDYVARFAERARNLLLAPLESTPPWWWVVAGTPSAQTVPAALDGALAALAESAVR